jgi:hypothetical protein
MPLVFRNRFFAPFILSLLLSQPTLFPAFGQESPRPIGTPPPRAVETAGQGEGAKGKVAAAIANSPLPKNADSNESPSVTTATLEFAAPENAPKEIVAAKVEVPQAPAATPASQTETALREKISRVLDAYIERPENSAERAPWGAMHGFISYGVDSTILVNHQRVNTIAYLAYNNPCRGIRLLDIHNGRPVAKVGVNVQGHEGQFLAMLAQSRVPKDYALRINGQSFTIADLIETEKKTCKARTELTFKLIAMSHYLDLEEKWTSDSGEAWSVSRLIKEELAQPVIGGACGGTHRLMGLSYASRNREKRGGAMEGEWIRAKNFIRDFQAYAFSLQNPRGSFSTEFFAGRADQSDPRKLLYTSGHITEWLAYSLPVEELADPKMESAINFLADHLQANVNNDLGVGPRGHGLHALVIYEERRFGARPGERLARLSQKTATKSR